MKGSILLKLEKTGKKTSVFARNSSCYTAAVIAAIITMFAYAVWEFFPFGDWIILRMDLYHQYAPLYAELYERVFGGDSLIYSFTSGLGSSFLGNYFNYLSSPTLLFVLAFGHINVPEAIAAIVLFKASASAFTFTYFLRRITRKNDITTAAFGLLYAFCGYFIAYYWNIMWLDAVVAFPLVMLGIWLIINKRKPMVYVCSLAYIMMTNYYMAYMTCILSVIFFLYFYFSENSLADSIHKNVVIKEKYKNTIGVKILNSRFLTSGFTFAGSSILAAMIAAFALLPVFFILQNSSATSSTFPTTFTSYFSIFDYFANHLAGVAPTIRSSGDTVYPNVYCGIITLILVPLYMFSKRFTVKEKIATTAVLALFYCSFNINILNFIWHGFHFPNDLPYRFSFAYSFFILFIAYKVLSKIKHISGKEILLSASAVAAFCVIVEKIGSANVESKVIWTSIVFAVVYAVILSFIKNPKYAKASISILLLTAVCAEILIADTPNYKVTQTKTAYTSSYEDTAEAIDRIEALEDENGFYRMELATLLTRMDNSWFYYNGVSTFTSMAYEKVANLQYCLGLFGNEINSYTYNCQTGLYNSMMSLKYIVDNSAYVNTDRYEPVMDDNFLYTKVDSFNDMTIYKNNYWLPVAFSVNNNTDKNWEFNNGSSNRDGNNPFASQNDFYYNATGISDILTPIEGEVSDTSNIDEVDKYAVNSGSFNIYKRNTSDSSGEITYKYEITETQNVYVYVSSRSVDSVLVSTDGFTYNQSLDNNAYILDVGNVEAGSDLYITYGLKEGLISGNIDQFVYGLDQNKFIEAYNTINKNGVLNVTENNESYIKGTINLAAGKMLYTSIPYDKGWSVYVDGEKLPEENIVAIGDALMGVYMDAGEHTVEFKYSPRGFVLGIGISVVGLLILILLFIFKKKGLLFFSESFKNDVTELGRWRDTVAETEQAELAAAEKAEFEEMLMMQKLQDEQQAEDASPWAAALAAAESFAKTANEAVAENEEVADKEIDNSSDELQENDEKTLESFEDYSDESIDSILNEFEKATDDIGSLKKNRITVDDKKSAQKKRFSLVIFVVVIAVALIAAIAIMINAVGGSKADETTGMITESTTVYEDTSDERTTATTSAPETTTQEETTTQPETTTEKETTTKAPETTTKVEYDGELVEYSVKQNDTLYSILRDHGVQSTPANVNVFASVNGINLNNIRLSIGDVLLVPVDLK